MCPTLLSVAVIKHSAEATWEEKGLCGLHSRGNASQGEIKSASHTATTEKGWHALAHAQLTFRHSTGLLAWRRLHTASWTSFSNQNLLMDVAAGQSDGGGSASEAPSGDSRLCPSYIKGIPKNKGRLDIVQCCQDVQPITDQLKSLAFLSVYSIQRICNFSYWEHLICALFRHSFSLSSGYILEWLASLLWRLKLEKYYMRKLLVLSLLVTLCKFAYKTYSKTGPTGSLSHSPWALLTQSERTSRKITIILSAQASAWCQHSNHTLHKAW